MTLSSTVRFPISLTPPNLLQNLLPHRSINKRQKIFYTKSATGLACDEQVSHPGEGRGAGAIPVSPNFRKHQSVWVAKSVLLSINTYLDMTICDRSGMFSGKLFLNVPAELRESWDRKDFSFPLVPRLLTLPELSEPFRRSVEGTLPLSEDSTSSVKRILESMVATRCEKHKPTTAPDLAERNRKLIWPLENQSEKSLRLYYRKRAIK